MSRWRDVGWLAARGLWHHRGRASLVAWSVALSVALPLALVPTGARIEARWGAMASEVPVVVGAPGSVTGLVWGGVLLRGEESLPTLPVGVSSWVAEVPGVRAVPIHRVGSALGAPVVGWSAEGPGVMGWRVTAGRWPGVIGEAVVGAEVARRVEVGATVLASASASGDPVGSPPLRLRVVGAMAPVSEGVDRAVWTTLETTWALGGTVHGHEAGEEVMETSLQGFTSAEPAAAPGRWHLHGDRDHQPVHAVWAVPSGPRARDVLLGRASLREGVQAAQPAEIVAGLLREIGQVRGLLHATATLVGLGTALLMGLVLVMTARERAAELALLRQLGASRRRVVAVWGLEVGAILIAGAALGAVLAAWLTGPIEAALIGLVG